MGYLVSRRCRAIAGLCTMALGAGAALGAFPGSAGATDGPERHDWAGPSKDAGVRACLEFGGGAKEFTIELRGGVLVETFYSDVETGVEVEIINVEEHAHGQLTFDFSANVPVEAVLATAHPHGLPSPFSVPAAAAGLVTAQPDGLPSRFPPPWVSVQIWASFSPISHISFCWKDEDRGTTPASEPPPTTSGSSTTTTGPSTTQSPTTQSPTTTIGQPSMPTTEPVTSTEASLTAPTTVPRGGSLARTGSNTGLLLTIGAVLLIGGSALLASTRHFRRRQV